MRVTDSKGSLENVGLVTGIVESTPVSSSPLGEGQERLLFAVRTSFDRLFQPSRFWGQLPQLGPNPQSFCFSFSSQSVMNPFTVIKGAYGQAFAKLEGAKKSSKPHQPKNSSAHQSNKGWTRSLGSEVQGLFKEADRLSCSSNPEDRLRANQAKLKAFQLLQIFDELHRQVQLSHQTRWTKPTDR